MKKRGFTLIEMLAVITILAIVMGISALGVIKVKNNASQKLLQNKMDDLVGSAILYGQQKADELQESCTIEGVSYNFCKEVTVKDLILNNYYNSSMDLRNDVTNYNMLCDKILIYRKNNRVYAKFINIYSNSENKTC
mgnify:CR=1 FL=1